MGSGARSVDAVGPEEAFRLLGEAPDTRLVDVRTRAEWSFVGLPDLSPIGKQIWPIEWTRFPDMAPNPAFLDELQGLIARDGGQTPRRILFICRSGARSLAAAQAVAAGLDDAPGDGAGLERCTNVAEGFEGDLDSDGHRGRINGWKARGLPWRQS